MNLFQWLLFIISAPSKSKTWAIVDIILGVIIIITNIWRVVFLSEFSLTGFILIFLWIPIVLRGLRYFDTF